MSITHQENENYGQVSLFDIKTSINALIPGKFGPKKEIYSLKC